MAWLLKQYVMYLLRLGVYQSSEGTWKVEEADFATTAI